jgi:hypothetical protein
MTVVDWLMDSDDAGGDTSWDRVPQPWAATTYSLLLLRDFGIDPRSEQMRQTIALVRDNCRWEEGGQVAPVKEAARRDLVARKHASRDRSFPG